MTVDPPAGGVGGRNVLRLPSVSDDFWELESGEARHVESPETFWIPPRADRERLRPGQLAKVLFRIDAGRADGSVEVITERMWVFVRERLDDHYLGVLDNQPGCIKPADDVYLVRGTEIPFGAEHVIDVADPPESYAVRMWGSEPSRRWPCS